MQKLKTALVPGQLTVMYHTRTLDVRGLRQLHSSGKQPLCFSPPFAVRMSEGANLDPQAKTHDHIVVGSGPTGSWAAKGFIERGLDSLVLERGRHVTRGEDSVTEHEPSWEFQFHGEGKKSQDAEEYEVRSKCNAFVTDGTCMTSSACQYPSITYMALTAQDCDYAVEETKRGNP